MAVLKEDEWRVNVMQMKEKNRLVVFMCVILLPKYDFLFLFSFDGLIQSYRDLINFSFFFI